MEQSRGVRSARFLAIFIKISEIVRLDAVGADGDQLLICSKMFLEAVTNGSISSNENLRGIYKHGQGRLQDIQNYTLSAAAQDSLSFSECTIQIFGHHS